MATKNKNSRNQKVQALFFDSYITAIKNSIGTKMFQTLWAEVGGKKRDITERGKLSCAVFVSATLLFFGLIKERHATVKGTLKDMKESGWRRIKKPRVGSVLVWEEVDFNHDPHEHAGFYIGPQKAVSNSWTRGTPIEHHWTFGMTKGKPKRRVVAIYWHPRLNKKYF